MGYCLRLSCQRPHNPRQAKFCQHCGARLLLGDRYAAFQKIGKGNTSRTFLGIDTHKLVDSRCIIKAFNVQDRVESMRRDMEQLEQVRRHPGIPTLFAYFERDGVLYFVQEFIDGATLEQELRAKGEFTEEQVWDVLSSALSILEVFHGHHIIHRDIKPTNLIRRRTDQQLMLVDFGSAKYATDSQLAKTGTLVGSAEYASLEQLMGRAVCASDLYSLGVTCVHLLTGLRPFELFNPADGTWVWRSVSGPVSSHLEQVLNRLLERNVADRYRSVAEVIEDGGNRLSCPHALTAPWPHAVAPVEPSPNSPHWYHSRTFIHEGGINAIAIPPNGHLLLTGGNDATVRLWDVGAELCIYTLTEHQQAITAIAISPDGKTLASSSWDQAIRLWDLDSGTQTHVLTGHQKEVTALAIAPITTSGTPFQLVSASRDGALNLWTLDTGDWCVDLSATLNPSRPSRRTAIEALAASTTQPIIASGDAEGTVHIWHVGTRERLRTLSRHDASVNAIALSTQREAIATGSADTTIRLRQLNTGGAIYTLTGHTLPVSAIAFSSDGEYLATGSYDGAIKLWELATGTCIQTLTRHTQPIVAVAFDTFNDSLISASRDGLVNVWQPSPSLHFVS